MKNKKQCSFCRGRMGLGIRFRNLWHDGWHHFRFCSAKCEAGFEKEVRDAKTRLRWFSFLAS